MGDKRPCLGDTLTLWVTWLWYGCWRQQLDVLIVFHDGTDSYIQTLLQSRIAPVQVSVDSAMPGDVSRRTSAKSCNAVVGVWR